MGGVPESGTVDGCYIPTLDFIHPLTDRALEATCSVNQPIVSLASLIMPLSHTDVQVGHEAIKAWPTNHMAPTALSA